MVEEISSNVNGAIQLLAKALLQSGIYYYRTVAVFQHFSRILVTYVAWWCNGKGVGLGTNRLGVPLLAVRCRDVLEWVTVCVTNLHLGLLSLRSLRGR